MTASGSFLQVPGLQLQPRVGGEGDQGEDTGLTGRLHSRDRGASMRLCSHSRTHAQDSEDWKC